MIKKRYKIKARMIEMENHEQVQEAPSPYAIFSLIYDGKLHAFHPISSKRFMNIMDKELKNMHHAARRKLENFKKKGEDNEA